MRRIKTLFLLFAFVLVMCSGAFAEITDPITADYTLTGNEERNAVVSITPDKKDILIDGDGNTVTGGGFKIDLTKESTATVTIKNLTLKDPTAQVAIDTGYADSDRTKTFFKGKLILDNVKIELSSSTTAPRAVKARSGTVVIKNCTFTSDGSSFAQFVEIESADVTISGDVKMGLSKGVQGTTYWNGGVFALVSQQNNPSKGTLRIESGDFEGESIVVAGYNLDNNRIFNTGTIYITGGVFNGSSANGLNSNLSLEPDFARRKVDVKITGGKFSQEGTPNSADLKALLSPDVSLDIVDDENGYWVVKVVEEKSNEGSSEAEDITKLDSDVRENILAATGLEASDFAAPEDVTTTDIADIETKSEDLYETLTSSNALTKAISDDENGVQFKAGTVTTFGIVRATGGGRVLQKVEMPSGKKFSLAKVVFYFIKATFFSEVSVKSVALAAEDDMVEATLLDAKTGEELTTGDLDGEFYAVPKENLEDTDYVMVAGEKEETKVVTKGTEYTLTEDATLDDDEREDKNE